MQSHSQRQILKLGLVGCGGRGAGAASQALAADDSVVLHAQCDLDPEVMSRAADILTKKSPKQVSLALERQFSSNAYKNFLREKENGHQLEHYPFFQAIRENHDRHEAERGARATMTAILGRMANDSGQEVTWQDTLASNQRSTPSNPSSRRRTNFFVTERSASRIM
ncbi:MAG: hypothetical protein AAF191_05445 [Verrucomicrobiota bacterium]